MLILSILQAAIQWKQQMKICRVGSIERVEIRDLRESWVGKTSLFAICLTMGKGTRLSPPESPSLNEHVIPQHPKSQYLQLVSHFGESSRIPKPINCENSALQLSQPVFNIQNS